MRDLAQDLLHGLERLAFHPGVVLFDDLLARVEEDSVATFRNATITALGVDLAKEGLAAPASTWTYNITDQPFGTALEQFMKGIRGLIRRAVRKG